MQIVLPYKIRNSDANCAPSWKGGDRGGWRTKEKLRTTSNYIMNNSDKKVFTRKEQVVLRQELRNNPTTAEVVLWNLLRRKQIDGLKFRRQHSVGEYIMDFYCPELKLCIEIDGRVHEQTEAFVHDMKRTEYLNSQGITIFRYSNEVVFNQPNGIIDSIKRFRENPNIIYGYILNNEIIYRHNE